MTRHLLQVWCSPAKWYLVLDTSAQFQAFSGYSRPSWSGGVCLLHLCPSHMSFNMLHIVAVPPPFQSDTRFFLVLMGCDPGMVISPELLGGHAHFLVQFEPH